MKIQILLDRTDDIYRKYVSNINNQGSRHKISLTPKGLEIAEAILFEGLDPLEKKVIEALKIRPKYLYKKYRVYTKKFINNIK